MEKIKFNIPTVIGTEQTYLQDAISCREIGGDGKYTRKCSKWIEDSFGVQKALLTSSCTSSLDIAVLLSGIRPGDEVILPSYTFSSTATSIVMAGGRLKFVDIRPDTMNIDEMKIEQAITEKTKAIMVVHYAGVSCEMDTIKEVAARYNLRIIEDAAQAIFSKYKDQYLGTIGDFGCFSFHETKNITMGEGGALLIREKINNLRAEIIREKGTNRSSFYRGEVDKYTWVDIGDSFLPSNLSAAFLWGQLQSSDEIQRGRMGAWKLYYEGLSDLVQSEKIELPFIPDYCVHNAHMFYIKVKSLDEREKLIDFLKENGINATFHFIPLHTTPAGKKYGIFVGKDYYTIRESERIVRLPLFYGITREQCNKVIEKVYDFFKG